MEKNKDLTTDEKREKLRGILNPKNNGMAKEGVERKKNNNIGGGFTYVVIYYDKEKGCSQIVKPTAAFTVNGNWNGLVAAITGGVYASFELR